MALYTRYISLYTGSGQLDKGFERGIIELGLPEPKPICYVERDFQAAALLVDKIQAGKMGKAPVWTDSSTFDSKPFIGKVDGIIGGFPCQPFSLALAGNQKGEEDERWLWEDIKRLAIQIRPKFLFLENVSGLIVGHGLNTILGDFTQIGYDAEWISIQAKHVGASHKRERVFILAYSDCKRLERKNTTKSPTSGSSRSFPPGRNIKQWEHIIKKRPDLSPTEIKYEICGVVNGVGRRLDSIPRIGQLRLLGNGVVPQQATAALKILFNRL